MDQWVKRTQKDYTLAFKLAVVDQVERGELTYGQAQERYGIQGASTVLVWLRKHGRQDWRAASSGSKGAVPMQEPVKPLTPEQRIKDAGSAAEAGVGESAVLRGGGPCA